MAQRDKDPAVSLQQLRSLWCHRFSSWPRNFHRLREQSKKKEEEEEEECDENLGYI